MFFKNHNQRSTALEVQQPKNSTINIEHLGAVSNINILEKEENTMLEKLKAYREELELKKASVIAANPAAEIDAEVAAYRESLIKAHAVKRDEAVKKLDSDIECISILIAREEESIAAATPVAAVEVVD